MHGQREHAVAQAIRARGFFVIACGVWLCATAVGDVFWSEDFEQGPSYKFQLGATSQIDASVAYRGTHSIRLTWPEGGNGSALSESIAVTPGETYVLTWACRTDETTQVAAALIHRYSARNLELESAVQSGRTGWREHAALFTPASGETWVRISLIGTGDGAVAHVWFDAFELSAEPGYLIQPHVVSHGAAALEGSSALGLWYAYPFRELYPDTEIVSDPCFLSGVYGQRGRVRVCAAANESEIFSLALRPETGALSLAFDATALSGTGGTIAASNITFKRVLSVPVSAVGLQSMGARLPVEPDPCPTLAKSTPVSFAASELSSLLVAVRVPKGTPAGVYAGSILITGDARTTVPLDLEVFDFSLPDSPFVISGAGFSANQMKQAWPNPKPTVDQVRVAGLDLFERCRQYPNRDLSNQVEQANWVTLNPGYTVTIDFTLFDQLMTDGLARGFSRFTLPPVSLRVRSKPPYLRPWLGLTPLTPEFNQAFGDYCQQLQAHLSANGWLDACVFYLWDEPSSDEFAQFTELLTLTRAHAPLIKNAVGGPWLPEPMLYGYEQVWDTNLRGQEFEQTLTQRTAERQALGERVGAYGNNRYALDCPLTFMRAWFWLLADRNLTSTGWWATNSWPSSDPWAGWAADATDRPGLGYLLYPPTAQTPPEIVTSLRWEALIQGQEDADLIFMFKEGVAAAQAVVGGGEKFSSASLASDLIDPVTSGSTETQYTFEMADLGRQREWIAGEVEQLQRRPFLLARWSLGVSALGRPQVVIRGRVEPASAITANATPVDVVDGAFTAVVPATPGCFSVTLRATNPSWPAKEITRAFRIGGAVTRAFSDWVLY